MMNYGDVIMCRHEGVYICKGHVSKVDERAFKTAEFKGIRKRI